MDVQLRWEDSKYKKKKKIRRRGVLERGDTKERGARKMAVG
jgi:hypothetical protein